MPCPDNHRALKWAYGVTTVPQRRHELLPQTLRSLAQAGFDKPWLFVDGSTADGEWARIQQEHGLPGATFRSPAVRTVANWILSMWELFSRNPGMDRYAIFQDDLVTYRNLRQYLDRSPYPTNGYLNLYTFKDNETVVRNKPDGWHEAHILNPERPRYQSGRGAVGLVFSHDALHVLLRQPILMAKLADAHNGHKKVDGMIVTAMNHVDWREYVHNPSLVQHTGTYSSMGNKPHRQAETFRGENFNALELLAAPAAAPAPQAS